MSRLNNRKILIINDNPIQARDLKSFLEREKKSTVYTAEDFKATMEQIRDNEIEVIMAEFTIPRNLKYKISRYCKRIKKTPPLFLIVNTRIIISKSKNKKNDEKVVILNGKNQERENIFTSRNINNFFDISMKMEELYEKPLSLEITNVDRAKEVEFLEIVQDGIICFVPEKLILNQVCEFIITNFLDIGEELRFSGVIKESHKDDEEDFYVTYIQLSKSSQSEWNKTIERLVQKQKEAMEFIKAANE